MKRTPIPVLLVCDLDGLRWAPEIRHGKLWTRRVS